MSSIYLTFSGDSACPYNRFLCPSRFCQPDFPGHKIETGPALMPEKGWDWIGFHGIPNLQTLIELQKRRLRGMKLLWSLDDDWYSIPDWNPAKLIEDAETIREFMCGMADAVLVTEEHLSGVMLKHIRRDAPLLEAPNLVDLSEFPAKPPKFDDKGYSFMQRLPVRVVWSGSATHREDIEQMIRPLDTLLSRLGPDEVQVIFVGEMPPAPLLRKYLHKGVLYHPPVTFEAYRKAMESIRPDVILCPLAPVDFNRSKSNLRVIESWGMIAVPVASDFGPYTCIHDGVDGFKPKDEYEWSEVLELICRDHQRRFAMAITGRLRCEAEYSWENPACRRKWNETFAMLLGCPVPESGKFTSEESRG